MAANSFIRSIPRQVSIPLFVGDYPTRPVLVAFGCDDPYTEIDEPLVPSSSRFLGPSKPRLHPSNTRKTQYSRRVQFTHLNLQPLRPAQCTFVAAAWTGIAVTLATQNHLRDMVLRMPHPWLDSFRFPLVECFFWFLLTPLLFSLVQRFDLFSGRLQRRLLLFGATNLAIILVHAAYRVPLHHFVYPAMQPISPPRLFRLYALGNALNDFWVFWSIVALAHLMTHYMRQAERERAVVRAQMQALKSQLQPHFFFNALNSISSLMREDVDTADDMITRLGDLLRLSLKTDPAHEIPLAEELRIIETYTAIERMRFSDRLRFTCELCGDAGQARVPALILLPLVENAVNHGIALRSQPGEVRISAQINNGSLIVTISNDLAAPQVSFNEGIGLMGTRRRLAQHYGGASSFTYHAAGGVMTVQITVPCVADEEFALHADPGVDCR